MRFGGIFLAATLLLGACSGDPEPKEPSPSATSQPTSTATPLPMPDQAGESGANGAAALADHWIKVLNYSSESGDTKPLIKLSEPACEGCNEYIDLIRSTYQAGGYFRGGTWKIENVQVAKAEASHLVAVDISWEKSTYKMASGESERIGGSGTDTVTLEIHDGRVRQLVRGVVR